MPNLPNEYLLFTRKNAFLSEHETQWRRCLAAYGGGLGYIRQALIQHLSEIAPEYSERLRRAAYRNYPRRIATQITQFVMSKRPERQGVDAAIAEDWTRTGLRADEVMRQFSTLLNICGCAWLAVDMPSFEGPRTKADELRERLRPYCVALSPLRVPDWCYAPDGKLLWAIVSEERIDNSDPWSQPHKIDIRRLWTRNDCTIVSRDTTTGQTTVTQVPHNLGVVPLVRYEEIDGFGIGENHWFEDIVRLSDAILNAGSESQMNIIKQMFGMLVIPDDMMDAASRRRDEDADSGNGKANEPLTYVLARSAALYESPESKGTCRYISPSGVETQAIRNEINEMRYELFDMVGLALSKGGTRLVESAEAKAWDFQSIEVFMANRADALEQCEFRAWELMRAWMPSIPVPTISYNRNFAIIDLKESVATLLNLSGFNQSSDQYQREIGKTALAMLNRLRQLPQDAAEQIAQDIDNSSPATEAAEAEQAARELQAALSAQGENEGGID